MGLAQVRYWALSGHQLVHCGCPLSDVKQTRINSAAMCPSDPKRKSAYRFWMPRSNYLRPFEDVGFDAIV